MLCGFYAIVFVAIALIQFAQQDGFNRKIGSLVVSGKYRFEENTQPALTGENEVLIDDAASVFFGGLEFRLASAEENNSLAIIDFDGIRRRLIPQFMSVADASVRFTMADGSQLAFYVKNNGVSDELIINAHLAEDAISLELPYRLTKNAAIGEQRQSTLIIIHNKQDYTFDRSILDTKRGLIEFSHKNPVISYRPHISEEAFNPADYIISGAMGKEFYDGLVMQWCETAQQEWQTHLNDEESDEAIITAYLAAAAHKFDYAGALSRIPETFASSSGQTFLSAPFFGKLESAAKQMTRIDQENQAGLEKAIQEAPEELLKQYKVFDYLLQRGKTTLFDEALQFIKTMQPGSISLEICPGIFEGWLSYNIWHKGKENPFEILATQARLFVSEFLLKDSENPRVFLGQNAVIDVFFNIRLGVAIAAYGDSSGNNEWAAIGRSLVLSALSCSDANGAIAKELSWSSTAGFVELESSERLSASMIYPYLGISAYYPHAVGASTVMFGVWLWTASPAIAASYKNNALEFEVTFPVSSPHYLIMFGIRPFSRIQMRDIDYRSDPRFETYNSPGWVYLPQEQTLLVKLVHRSESERVKIFFSP
jgi:hypothetical protein